MSGEVLTLPIDRSQAAGAMSPAAGADWSAFEQVYSAHSARMKSIAYNLLGNEQDAEDALQEAFLKACRAQSGFRQDAALHTWVYRILINICLDEGRRRHRRPSAETGIEAVSGHAGADLRFALRQAVLRLPPRQRAVFLMAAVEGLPHAEIGGILEITETNSRTLLLEARRQLQAELTK